MPGASDVGHRPGPLLHSEDRLMPVRESEDFQHTSRSEPCVFLPATCHLILTRSTPIIADRSSAHRPSRITVSSGAAESESPMQRHVGLLVVLLAIPATTFARVSVLDHGAKADGRTDDTAAVQRAMDAAAKDRKIGVIAPGKLGKGERDSNSETFRRHPAGQRIPPGQARPSSRKRVSRGEE
jgi:Pectate lyase superfamily protein